jgi:hypothetical protein
MLRPLKPTNPRGLSVNPRSLQSNNSRKDATRLTTNSQPQQTIAFDHENQFNNGIHSSQDNSYWTDLPLPISFSSNAESETSKVPYSSRSTFSDASRHGRAHQRQNFGSSDGLAHSRESSRVWRRTPKVLTDTVIPVIDFNIPPYDCMLTQYRKSTHHRIPSLAENYPTNLAVLLFLHVPVRS